MPMKNPVHPGVIIRDGCLGDDLTVTAAAHMLGVSRVSLSRILNGRGGVSPEMAVRLEKVGWSTADFWMRCQASYDLAQTRLNQDRIKVNALDKRSPTATPEVPPGRR